MANKEMQFGDFTYYKVPKDLFKGPYQSLSTNAKLLYAILLDLRNISVRNATDRKWRDHNGDIYVICSQNKVQSLLLCKHDKAGRVLKELEDFALIRRNKTGCGHCDQIVVLPMRYWSGKQVQHTSDSPKSFIGNSELNNNDNSNKDISINELKNVFYEIYDMYPVHRRGNRDDAFEVFGKTITTYDDAQMVLDNCRVWCQSTSWTNKDGMYVPLLSNFLRKEYWRKKPPQLSSVTWCSKELGEAELEAIHQLMQGE